MKCKLKAGKAWIRDLHKLLFISTTKKHSNWILGRSNFFLVECMINQKYNQVHVSKNGLRFSLYCIEGKKVFVIILSLTKHWLFLVNKRIWEKKKLLREMWIKWMSKSLLRTIIKKSDRYDPLLLLLLLLKGWKVNDLSLLVFVW